MDEITKKAVAAIGADDAGSDWRLAPEAHAAQLPAEAGALKRILEMPNVKAIMMQFRAADQKAVAAQKRYRRMARSRLYTAVAATLIGAVVLLPLEIPPGPMIRNIPAALQYGCLAISFLASVYLTYFKPFDTWMKARAAAEIARIGLFNHVMDGANSAQPGELPLLPLKLEYFRRYQMEVQRRYYHGRGRQHDEAAGHTRHWQLIALSLSAVATMVALVAALKIIIDFGVPVPEWVKALNDAVPTDLRILISRAVLAIGIAASALLGATASRSLMDLDERNASRYLTTAANLDYVAEGLDAIRERAAAGDEASVHSFVARIQDMVSSEHREWVVLREVVPRMDQHGVQVG